MSQLTCATCESRPFGKGEGMEDIRSSGVGRSADGDCNGPLWEFTIKQQVQWNSVQLFLWLK